MYSIIIENIIFNKSWFFSIRYRDSKSLMMSLIYLTQTFLYNDFKNFIVPGMRLVLRDNAFFTIELHVRMQIPSCFLSPPSYIDDQSDRHKPSNPFSYVMQFSTNHVISETFDSEYLTLPFGRINCQ